MKKALFGLALLSTVTSYANTSLDSSALAGQYKLTKASSEFAAKYHCSEEIEVKVNERSVTLEGISDNNSHASFWSEDAGCEKGAGDIGPLRKKCTTFKENSVSYSDTSYLTIVGYVREVESIKVKGDKLTFSNNIIQVPFGILGIFKDDEFKCDYKRVSLSN